MNTVIYARYSAGPRQTDQSIEGQLRVCTDFCKQRGLTVIDTYCDRHISGRTDERPEFQRLIADAKRKKFEAVVVYKTDRFARNKYDSAVYKRELKRNGIQIFYAAEAIPDGPEGIILESLMEGLAEYYSAELAQKIKRGMHESALKCQSTGSGRPLGYRVDEQKHFQIDPEAAQTVQTIFEQYIKGESNAAICELLNSRGLRTAQGKPFNKNSINRIIKNRKYIGEYRYHDIVVEGGMPAIISKDTFNLAQAEMERRRTRKAPKSPKAEYLLAGRLFCGHCKGPMQGVSGTGKSGNKWYYYYCGNTRGKNKTCDKKQVSRDRLERAVVDFTVRYILQEDVLEELARKVHVAQERQNDTTSEIVFYEKKLADNKKSIANVLRAIESGAATQTLPARLQELENEQAVILGELSFLKGKHLAFTEDQILFALMKHLEPYPGESEQDYRRRIISDFVSEVYLYDDRLLIYFNISSEDGKLKSADLSNIEGSEFDEGLVSSTNRNAVEPSEFDVISSSSGGFLFAEMGKITRSKSPVFWSVILNLTSARSSYSRMDETNVSRMRRRYSSSTSSSSRRNCSNMNVSASRLNWGGVGALLISPRAKVSWASCSSRARRRAARRALPPSSMASRILFCLRRHSASSASRASFSGLPFGSCSLACNSIMQSTICEIFSGVRTYFATPSTMICSR